ncbi:MAG TPA: glycosyltransferase family A protein [Anaerolineaceae bacterium]
MRIGQNPAKYVKEVARPARITVAVLNYIPFLSGFYADALEVLKVCLESIRESADLPFDLLVFDNGSCEEARQYLLDEHQAGRVQFLFLSEKNLGKGGAWNIILGGAPGEIIAYTDSDAYFYKGWLSRSLQILETYPNVGMVTARPFRTREEYYSNTLTWGQSTPGVAVERGALIPFEVFREFDRSLGQSDEEIQQHYQTSEDICLTYQGVRAMAGASHWQFMAYKSVLQPFLPFSMDRPMGQVKQLDQRMNETGLLRLMVTDPLAMNMSNTLRNAPGQAAARAVKRAKGASSNVLLDLPPVRRALLGLYDAIFRWYYDRQAEK